ncbi:MAG: hypothetical protein R3199_09280 [Gemmatimonadota bacterium]|nr:hypothetical protein [Gemmatimonadota bacterium]
MIRMTDQARERVDGYVANVRRALRPHPEVDADEVASDVRAHIEEALRGSDEPAREDEVIAVLDRLGSPGRWVPEEELGGLHGIIARIRRGPDDWRLAYLCLGLTVLGILAAPVGGALLLLPAFVLARGALTVADERGEPMHAQRWLVYPALVLVYVPVSLVLLLLPVALSPAMFATGGLVEYLDRSYPAPGTPGHFVTSVGWTVVATGAWWAVLGGIAAVRPGLVRTLLRPFADRFRRAAAWIPVLVGVAVSVAGIVVISQA